MRKLITVCLTAMLLVAAFALPQAEAKKKKVRKVSGAYSAPSIGAGGLGVCSPGTIGCIPFALAAGEKFVSINIVDQSGQAVFASITQDLNGDNQSDTSTDICGATEEPVAIEPGYEVTVFIWEGPGPAPLCAGVATSGEIQAEFSK
jgi:hypothetical protein